MAVSLALGTLSFLLAVIWGSPSYSAAAGKRSREKDSHRRTGIEPTQDGHADDGRHYGSGAGGCDYARFEHLQFDWRERLSGVRFWSALMTLVGFGLLGGYDDWSGLRGGRRARSGLLGRYKILVQIALAVVIALILYFPLDIHSIAIPTISQKINLGLHLYSDCGLYHCGHVERGEFYGWAGFAGRMGDGVRVCGIRRDCVFAAANLFGDILFHYGGRAAGVSLV